jgi:hypothetical protein
MPRLLAPINDLDDLVDKRYVDTINIHVNLAIFNETFILLNNGGFELISVTAIQNLTNSNSGTITFRNNGTSVGSLSSLSISGTRSGTFIASSDQTVSTGTNLDIVVSGLTQSIQLAFTLRIRRL